MLATVSSKERRMKSIPNGLDFGGAFFVFVPKNNPALPLTKYGGRKVDVKAVKDAKKQICQ